MLSVYQKHIKIQRIIKMSFKPKVLTNIQENGPALVRAQMLQEKAAAVGFDWPNIHCVIEKLHEELKEFEFECNANNDKAAQEELGDILFACANLARHLKINAESVVEQANAKFERRFNGVESLVEQSGKDWQDFKLDELEAFWQAVKKKAL